MRKLDNTVRVGLMVPGLVISVIAVMALFCPATVHSRGEEQKTAAPQKVVPPASPTAIPVAEIAARATEVSNQLRALTASLTPSPQIGTIQNLLSGVSERIDKDLAETARTLEEQPTLEQLQARQQRWQALELQTSGWLKVLTDRAVLLRHTLDQVSDLKQTWLKTADAARASKAPVPVLQEVNETLAAIDAAAQPLEAERASVLSLQSQVAGEVSRCSTALAHIADAQRHAVGGILTRDSRPIWSPELWADAKAELPASSREVVASCRREFSQYLSDTSKQLPLHLGIFILLVALFFAMRRRLQRWESDYRDVSPSLTALDRPYAAALLYSLFVASGPSSAAPATIKALFGILAIAPMIRLTKPVIDQRLVPGLYALWVLFAADAIRQVFAGRPLIGQAILVFEALLGIIVLGWSLHSGPLRTDAARTTGPDRTSVFRVIGGLILFALVCSLVAAATGYLRISRILGAEIIAGGIVGLTLYTSIRVLAGMIAFAFRVWPLRLLNMVEHQRALLEGRTHVLLVWAAVIAWAARSLDYIGLLQPALSLGSTILAIKLERGSISISIADILLFLATLYFAYLLSAFIRFALREDVYPRIGIPRGASYAASSLLNYVILALGFVVALAIIGVDLTRLTVLVGAFGVGIGFGLQSVINNFVSGLILLFERPIHVGDAVEIGDLLGEVRRIGIRASVVRTWHGSDIIVPNADFISKQVTNWTLGDSLRRIDIDVGVNYGAEPKEVIRVLEGVARSHPDVLSNPPPQGLFTGYGDSSINFELRAWTDKFDAWPRIKSDLAVALYDAAHEAGMSFPFPQREVRVLNCPGAEPTAPPVDRPAGEAIDSGKEEQ
jgi:potassium-dependent mechanosensitive channel